MPYPGRTSIQLVSNGWAFNGEPSDRSERPERSGERRVRWYAMLASAVTSAQSQSASATTHREEQRTRSSRIRSTVPRS